MISSAYVVDETVVEHPIYTVCFQSPSSNLCAVAGALGQLSLHDAAVGGTTISQVDLAVRHILIRGVHSISFSPVRLTCISNYQPPEEEVNQVIHFISTFESAFISLALLRAFFF